MHSCSKVNALTAAMMGLGVAFSAPAAMAAEAATFASSFAVPTFDQIDQNGVDLVTGTWRVHTPTIWFGEGSSKHERGLEWTGQAWTHIGQPSLWRNSSKYIVMYKGGSYEFNGFGSGFSKRAPIDGSSLSCDTLSGGDGISYCRFTSRDGDFVVFQGFYSALSNFGPKMGFSSLQNGNVGIQDILVSEVAFGSPPIIRMSGNNYIPGTSSVREFGYQEFFYGSMLSDENYNKVNYAISMADQNILVNTPNNGATDEHYLLPKSTTQTITNDNGAKWFYEVNGNRELVRVTQPGGAGSISATYHGDHKVKSITTPSGTWNYSYTTLGDFGTTTVVNPQNEVAYVKYHSELGYVTEARDGLSRVTYYSWNSGTRRLDRVTFPEGNYVAFTYDTRGNVTFKTEVSKGGASSLLSQAGYASSCSSANQANCNQPQFVIDPKNNRTDLEYTDNSPGPTKVTLPAASADEPRPTVSNVYSGGALTRSSMCRTQATCAGTVDEVVTENRYFGWPFANSWRFDGYIAGSLRVLDQVKVTADGQSIVTCHQYDNKGHLVGTTPPNANIVTCPTGLVGAVAVTSNPPTYDAARSAPTFPGVPTP